MNRSINLKIVLLLAFVATFIGAGYGQQGTSQVKYNKTVHDFGKIKEVDGKVSCTFEFTNTSSKPFIIDFVSVSCGCTTPEYTKAPVLPGKSGKIDVTFNPTGQPGIVNKSIVITSNDRKDQVTLKLTAEVIPKPRTPEDNFPVELSQGLRANSASFLFGYLPRGRKATQAVDIYNGGTTTVTLGARIVGGESNSVSIKILPITLKPKEKGQITVTYDVTTANIWGLVNTIFELTANGKAVTGKFNAYATVTEDFSQMTPEQIKNGARADFVSQFYHFGDFKASETQSHQFTITNSGESTLYLRSIKPNSSAISYTIDKTELKKGETATLTATLKNCPVGRVSESITIILNDPSRPMREIRLAGVANP